MNAIERLDRCIELLNEHGSRFTKGVEESGQPDDPPSLVFKRAFSFCTATLEAIRLLLRSGEGYVLMAMTLCRPMFELSMRILWAARAPGGWNRLQSHLADEDRKWAEEATKIATVAETAHTVLKHAREVLSRKDEAGKPFQPAPDMRTILREIEEVDFKEGYRDTPGDAGQHEYTNLYRIMCRPAHANITAIGMWKPDVVLQQTTMIVIYSTMMLLKAVCHVEEGDEKRAVESVLQQAIDLIKDGRSLSFSQCREVAMNSKIDKK